MQKKKKNGKTSTRCRTVAVQSRYVAIKEIKKEILSDPELLDLLK